MKQKFNLKPFTIITTNKITGRQTSRVVYARNRNEVLIKEIDKSNREGFTTTPLSRSAKRVLNRRRLI